MTLSVGRMMSEVWLLTSCSMRARAEEGHWGQCPPCDLPHRNASKGRKEEGTHLGQDFRCRCHDCKLPPGISRRASRGGQACEVEGVRLGLLEEVLVVVRVIMLDCSCC